LILRTHELIVQRFFDSNRYSFSVSASSEKITGPVLHGNIRKSGDLKIAGRHGFYRLTSTGYGYLSKFRRGNANGSVTFFQTDEKNPDFYRRLW
jgi:hypothetical protein